MAAGCCARAAATGASSAFCVQRIDGDDARANATFFVAKFFGRSTLLSFVSSAPLGHLPAVFRSLLYEACSRTINPVGGAAGLLWNGRWRVCHAAVETVLAGGTIRPLHEHGFEDLYRSQKRGTAPTSTSASVSSSPLGKRRSTATVGLSTRTCLMPDQSPGGRLREGKRRAMTPPASTSEISVTTTTVNRGGGGKVSARRGGEAATA